MLRQKVRKLSKSLSQTHNNTATREAFNNTKRRYKSQLKRARQELKNKISEALDPSVDNNPKLYWKLLNQLKRIDDVGDQNSDRISINQWVSHYTKLFQVHNTGPSDEPVLEELTRGPKTLTLLDSCSRDGIGNFLQIYMKNSLLQTKSIEIWVNFHTAPHYACINFRSFSTP